MIQRRDFLSASAATLAAPALARGAGIAPAHGKGLPDVAVVGAGVFGAFTALTLRERGHGVLSLDQYGPVSPRASSSGETRSIRSGYGDQAFYSAWSARALAKWKLREAEYGRKLLYPSARIELTDRWHPAMLAQRKIFDDLKLPYEIASRDELRRRFPQMGFDDVDFAFVETAASSVLVKAREAVLATIENFEKKGGQSRFARAVPGEVQGRRLLSLRLDGGESISAGSFVFAVGPWAGKLLPGIARPRVHVWRSEYLYYGTPAGDPRFSWPHQPLWHDHIRGGWGFGSIERGLKYSVAPGPRVAMDPDTAERLPREALMEASRAYIAARFPALAGAPIMESRVCQVDDANTTNFLIDRHPDFDNVFLAFAGGGHGFKHGPMVGDYVADLVTGRPTEPEARRLFEIAAHPAAG
jgi:glycine/D-amino acid oxidase-like deaminating enzyme